MSFLMFLSDLGFLVGQLILIYFVIGLFFSTVGDRFVVHYNKIRAGKKKHGIQ